MRRIYGDPVERDGVTVVPAAAVLGGTGGGGDAQGNGGGGFGLAGRPVGAWVIGRDGSVSWRPAFDLNRTLFLAALVVLVAAWRRR